MEHHCYLGINENFKVRCKSWGEVVVQLAVLDKSCQSLRSLMVALSSAYLVGNLDQFRSQLRDI